MNWIVTIETDNDAGSATVEVSAPDKGTAAFRAAIKIERDYRVRTGRLIAARRT